MLVAKLLTEVSAPIRSVSSHRKILNVCSGSGEVVTDNCSYGIFPGLIIIIPPEIEYTVRAEGSYQIISVEGNFSRLHFLDEVACMRDNIYNEGKMLAEAIIRSQHSNRDYMMTLADAYVKYISQHIMVSAGFSAIIHEITNKIDAGYADVDFDITALICSVGYTEDYVRSKFLQITGMTPVKYLTSVRMNNAKLMLGVFGKDTSVQEIAVRCGYFDAAYFSRCFKKLFGISPKQYRESLKGKL